MTTLALHSDSVWFDWRGMIKRWGPGVGVSVLIHLLVLWILIANPFAARQSHRLLPPVLEVLLQDPLPPPDAEPLVEPEPVVLPTPQPLPEVIVPPRAAPAVVEPIDDPTDVVAAPASEPADLAQPVEEDPPARSNAVPWETLIRDAASESVQEQQDQQSYQGMPNHLNMPSLGEIELPGGGEPQIFTDMWPLLETEVEYLGNQDGVERMVVRLPDGTELCGERRAPDPVDNLDISMFLFKVC